MLDRLWSDGRADVRTMHDAVGRTRGISFNTVQSTLERLFRKGLASREKTGRAYVYRAALSRREWIAQAVHGISSALPREEPASLLQAFVDLADRAGEEQLAELERLVRERRRRARRGEPS